MAGGRLSTPLPPAATRLASRVALGSLAVDVVFVAAKLTAGLATGSLGLLSEAAHSGLDLAASAFALAAVRTAAKPADTEHPYGHGRAENLAAFSEGVVLMLTALVIAFEGARRLLTGHAEVDPALFAIGLLVFTMSVEAVRAVVLTRTARRTGSAALAASSQNRVADIMSSAGALVGLVGVRSGLWWADAVAALAIAVVIGRAALRLAWRSGDILIDRAPAGVEDQLRASIAAVPGVRSVGAVRVRYSGTRMIADAAITIRSTLSVEGGQRVVSAVREEVGTRYPDLDLTLAVQAATRTAHLVERVHATAARQGGVRDLHNVTIEREGDGSLHLSMHAKLPGDLRLADAARASADLERALREEFPDAHRVDVHLEPLEPDVITGEDVTRLRPELADRARAVIAAHPEVRECRDVEISARGQRLVAHVVASMSGEATLDHAHTVETELEGLVRTALPEVADVVARVAPDPGPDPGP